MPPLPSSHISIPEPISSSQFILGFILHGSGKCLIRCIYHYSSILQSSVPKLKSVSCPLPLPFSLYTWNLHNDFLWYDPFFRVHSDILINTFLSKLSIFHVRISLPFISILCLFGLSWTASYQKCLFLLGCAQLHEGDFLITQLLSTHSRWSLSNTSFTFRKGSGLNSFITDISMSHTEISISLCCCQRVGLTVRPRLVNSWALLILCLRLPSAGNTGM